MSQKITKHLLSIQIIGPSRTDNPTHQNLAQISLPLLPNRLVGPCPKQGFEPGSWLLLAHCAIVVLNALLLAERPNRRINNQRHWKAMSSNEPGQNLVLILGLSSQLHPRPCACRGRADDDDCLFVHNDVETSLNDQKSRIYSYGWQKPTCTSQLLYPIMLLQCCYLGFFVADLRYLFR